MGADFDRYSDDYRASLQRSIAFAGRSHEFYLRVKARHLLRVLRRQLGDARRLRLLDVGCGIGLTHAMLRGEVGSLTGVDESAECLRTAKHENPGVLYHAGDARRLPLEESRFEVVFAINVLHHVEVSDRAAVLKEMARVCRPGGLVVIFEHNPLNPLTRRVVRTCPFDADAALLSRTESMRRLREAGLETVEARFILVLPSESRLVSWLEAALGGVPLGAQYYVAGRK